MLRRVFTFLVLIESCFYTASAQKKPVFSVANSENFDTLELKMKIGAANCSVEKALEAGRAIDIYSSFDIDTEKLITRLTALSSKKKCAQVYLNSSDEISFAKSVTYAFKSKSSTKPVYLNLNKGKVYNLDLSSGFGNIDLDLTGISMNNLKIKSGSASISVGYLENNENLVDMDTLMLNSGFGEIYLEQAEGLRAKHIITKVGFGNILLNYNKFPENKSKVKASVGGGDIDIFIPRNSSTAVMISVGKSPLCSLEIPDDFEEVDENIFVNRKYQIDAKNLIEFDLDVSMGSLIIEYKD